MNKICLPISDQWRSANLAWVLGEFSAIILFAGNLIGHADDAAGDLLQPRKRPRYGGGFVVDVACGFCNPPMAALKA